MTKKSLNNDEESAFRALFADAKPVRHSRYMQDPKEKRSLKSKQAKRDPHKPKQRAASFEFSDGFEAHFDPSKALKYSRGDAHAAQQVKRLRRSEIVPELILDLHGLTLSQTKLELSAVIDEALRKRYECIQIIHGVSGGVLKQNVPNYLVQHPKVLGFHQAPLEFGGKGALLVLVETDLF